ncbi:MAG: hypothetical protein D4R97_04960 [Bacteroidetes bacterium]|nr:MAG: hypothetical protein D4R97_04960 [Bacteroidota bacterium]
MKKSNIILVSAIGLAFCWTILIGWFASSAINNHIQKKDPYFARSHRQYMENRKKIFPAPVRELLISGNGSAIINILPGKELCVLSHPSLWICDYTDLKNGKAMISFKKLIPYSDPVTIMLPEIPSLSLDNFSRVTLIGMDRKEIQIHCTRVDSFISDSCRIGALNLDFPRTRDIQDICINKSNVIENLIASVRGSGKLRLETAGQIKNQLTLSDSVRVEASVVLMKKLSR